MQDAHKSTAGLLGTAVVHFTTPIYPPHQEALSTNIHLYGGTE